MEIQVGNDKYKGDNRARCDFPLFPSLAENVDRWGDVAVNTWFLRGAGVGVQGAGRFVLDKGGSLKEAVEAMRTFDLRSGRSVRPTSAPDAMRCIARETQGLERAQIGQVFEWFGRNGDATEEALKRFIASLKDGKVVDSTHDDVKGKNLPEPAARKVA